VSFVLEARHLSFRYRPGLPCVVDDVSVDVRAGDFVGLLGPNGSGKTTLLRLLSGTLRPSAGTATLDGRDVVTQPRHLVARRLAVVPQETHLAFDYTVLEMVLMGRYPRLGAFEIEGPDDLASALDALEATGTRDLAERPFPTLSGGEKQRVIIASALAQLDERDPAGTSRRAAALLLLDEPTASLDLKYQLEIAALLRRLNHDRGITIVLSTHDLRLASSVCRDLLLLRNGRLLAHGSPRDILTPAGVGTLYDIDPAAVAPMLS